MEIEPQTEPIDWMKEALCKGSNTNLFFPEDKNKQDIEKAKRICGQCAVQSCCLEYAIENRIKEGVWGGASERDRRRIIRRRKRDSYPRTVYE